MGKQYKPHRPDFYPTGWLTAARIAARPENLEAMIWTDVDWAKTEFGAVNRMQRLRAFRKGLEAEIAAGAYPDLQIALQKQLVLTFRKIAVRGVWAVQLRWKPEPLVASELLAGE